ncbi:putative transposase protein [Shigella dysenteriae 225-75]|nr:putative transposase protein [Shigella dysenteriae 225-75]
MLARVLISKYAEHTPLYRQSEMYGRQGVELSRSLLSGLGGCMLPATVTAGRSASGLCAD